MTTERRRSPRIEILGKLHGHVVALDVPAHVTELSMSGMGLQTDFALPLDAVHSFRLTLGDGSTVTLAGRVVRCQEVIRDEGDPVYVSGVEFIDETVDPATIESLIDQDRQD